MYRFGERVVAPPMHASGVLHVQSVQAGLVGPRRTARKSVTLRHWSPLDSQMEPWLHRHFSGSGAYTLNTKNIKY